MNRWGKRTLNGALYGLLITSCATLFAQGLDLNFSSRSQDDAQSDSEKKIQTLIPGYAGQIAFENPIDPTIYKVGPGDHFALSIRSMTNYYYEMTVNPIGELIIPGIGTIDVLNLNLLEVQALIKEKALGVFRNSNIQVSFIKPRIISVFLVGAVQKPGAYDVIYTSRVSDILDKTQTSTLFAKPESISVISQDDTTSFAYHNYLYKGDLTQNPVLKMGDLIFVEEINPGVSVSGYVTKPGLYPYIPSLTYVDYVGMAGGALPTGDTGNYFVTSGSNEVKPDSALIKPGDNIYIPRSKQNLILGELSVLQVVTSVSSLILTYIAATR